jgi:hypothetical protein
MKTYIKTIHEETYNDNSRTLGVLLNYNDEENFKESFVYIYRDKTYIFFETIIDMIDYLMYGEVKMKRAYMEESEFDLLLDAENIDDKFNENLKW